MGTPEEKIYTFFLDPPSPFAFFFVCIMGCLFITSSFFLNNNLHNSPCILFLAAPLVKHICWLVLDSHLDPVAPGSSKHSFVFKRLKVRRSLYTAKGMKREERSQWQGDFCLEGSKLRGGKYIYIYMNIFDINTLISHVFFQSLEFHDSYVFDCICLARFCHLCF